MIVLVIHFIAEVVGNKRKPVTEENKENKNVTIFHPAEFQVR
jgi:hypothetical protein